MNDQGQPEDGPQGPRVPEIPPEPLTPPPSVCGLDNSLHIFSPFALRTIPQGSSPNGERITDDYALCQDAIAILAIASASPRHVPSPSRASGPWSEETVESPYRNSPRVDISPTPSVRTSSRYRTPLIYGAAHSPSRKIFAVRDIDSRCWGRPSLWSVLARAVFGARPWSGEGLTSASRDTSPFGQLLRHRRRSRSQCLRGAGVS